MGKKQAKRDLDNLSLDPSQAADSDPESWDEQPERDGGEDKYLAQRPPHHGD